MDQETTIDLYESHGEDWQVDFGLAISCLVFLQYKASRGSHKAFSLAMFLSYLGLCPLAFLCVSCGSIEWGRHWREILSFGYFLEAYSIQFGIVLGVALVMPLVPNVDDFSEIIYERSSAARIESALSCSLHVIEVLLSVCFFDWGPDEIS
ncbi:MAG: hypothetical protein LW850_33305 [Planctomycetaceae bacterium]|jgi:hypothetical protein|nr:hypothetical protein [Planctomycetaceae bacterium]